MWNVIAGFQISPKIFPRTNFKLYSKTYAIIVSVPCRVTYYCPGAKKQNAY